MDVKVWMCGAFFLLVLTVSGGFGLGDVIFESRQRINFDGILSSILSSGETLDYAGYIENYSLGGVIKFRDAPVLVERMRLKGTGLDETRVLSETRRYRSQVLRAHEVNIKTITDGYPHLVIRNEFKNIFNGVSVTNISREDAERIRELDFVEEVYPITPVHALLTESVSLINADDVWNTTDGFGRNVTGINITIAVIDTGIDYTHADLGSCSNTSFLNGSCAKVIGGYNFVSNTPDPMDDQGHGTHCAATAAGNGVLKGVAPDAKILAYKVLNENGSGSVDDIIAGIDRAVDPNDDGNYSDHADVISLSLGGPGSPDDVGSQAVDNAVEAGVVVVVAAGNDGPEAGTIGSPGCARKALTVGAACKPSQLNNHSYCNTTTQYLAEFSSLGPSYIYNKPDVLAPGVGICAAQWGVAFESRGAPLCVDDDHIAISGTSMATPHVAGAAALVLQKHPDWTPLEVKASFERTAVSFNYSRHEEGAGQIDVLAAAQLSAPAPVAALFDVSNLEYL